MDIGGSSTAVFEIDIEENITSEFSSGHDESHYLQVVNQNNVLDHQAMEMRDANLQSRCSIIPSLGCPRLLSNEERRLSWHAISDS